MKRFKVFDTVWALTYKFFVEGEPTAWWRWATRGAISYFTKSITYISTFVGKRAVMALQRRNLYHTKLMGIPKAMA